MYSRANVFIIIIIIITFVYTNSCFFRILTQISSSLSVVALFHTVQIDPRKSRNGGQNVCYKLGLKNMLFKKSKLWISWRAQWIAIILNCFVFEKLICFHPFYFELLKHFDAFVDKSSTFLYKIGGVSKSCMSVDFLGGKFVLNAWIFKWHMLWMILCI